ncbi:hypothetical protein DBR11_22045, partial [Pedobacter sp. HMWF019]|uniref:ArnT family glycosyltransferase n=1 Tax=Pedobacter sp. HMWF019 TaxID=2056856 RepID=UPI000D4C2EFA
MTLKNKVLWLIAISSLLRIVIAATTALGNDEVYYWTYALQPDWNHFDHPPLVGLMIRLFTLNLHFREELFVRLGALFSSAFCTLILYRMLSRLHSETAGWYAALLYTSSFYCSIIAGLLILPDSPQLFFWLISVYLMMEVFIIQPEKHNKMLLLGLSIGLATMCKVHGVFLWVAAGAYILFFNREWLARWQLYLSILIFFLITSPILLWNIQNHFITYTFHEARVSSTGGTFKPLDLLRELLGEILYNSPLNYLLYLIALTALFRGQFQIHSKLKYLLLLLAFPLLATIWIISSFNPTLPHWTGPAFIALIILTSIYLAQRQPGPQIPLLVKVSLTLTVVTIISAWIYINCFPGTMGSKSKENLGEGDPALDMYGWDQLRDQFKYIRTADLRSHLMQASSPVLSEKWFPAAHLEFYIAEPLNTDLLAAGSINNIHKFAWLNYKRKLLQTGENCYYITPSTLAFSPEQLYGAYFKSISKPIEIPIK